jgi:hypothetical protein
MRKSLISVFVFILLGGLTTPASAANTLVYSNATTCGGWGPGTTPWTFRMNTTVGGTIGVIEIPLNSSTNASTITLRIFNEVSGAPGTVLGVFNYDASSSSSTLARFLGSATVGVGNFYWQFYSSPAADPCSNGSYANSAGANWSALAYRFTSSSTTGPFTYDAAGGGAYAIQLKLYTTVADTTPPTFPSVESFNVAENQTLVGTIRTSESSTISLFGGSDQAKFSLATNDSTTATLSFASAPNFESPTDFGSDNTYQVVLRAVDTAGNTGYETVTATVTDVDENARLTSYTVSGFQNKGQVTTVVATVNVAAKVTFYANGKRIAGCIGKATTGSGPITATCAWRPTVRGTISLSFRVVPNASNYFATTSANSTVNIGKRTTTR